MKFSRITSAALSHLLRVFIQQALNSLWSKRFLNLVLPVCLQVWARRALCTSSVTTRCCTMLNPPSVALWRWSCTIAMERTTFWNCRTSEAPQPQKWAGCILQSDSQYNLCAHFSCIHGNCINLCKCTNLHELYDLQYYTSAYSIYIDSYVHVTYS